MQVGRNRITVLTLWAIALLLLMGPARADEVVRKSFEVGDGGWLNVESDLGSIEVKATRGNQVDVKIVQKGVEWNRDREQDTLKDFEVDFSQKDNDVYVKVKYRGGGDRYWRQHRNTPRIQFLITVPARYNVDLITAGGSISVGNLEGEARTETSGGSLHFGSIRGPVKGRTSGGSISLESCVGSADIKTSGGSITIGDVEGTVEAYTSGGSIRIDKAQGSVRARTSGGSIDVREVMGDIDATTSGGSVHASISRQPQGDCHLETSGGNVTVSLAPDIAVDVDAKSSWGKIESDFEIGDRSGWKESTLRGKINGGGPQLFLRTSSGRIGILKM